MRTAGAVMLGTAGAVVRGALCVLWWWGAALPAQAWGLEGHRLTGHMAEQLLDAKTRLRVTQILEGGTLAQAATYMDVERDALAQAFPRSAEWHYDDKPVCTKTSGKAYCPGGHCASSRIKRYSKVLADTQAPLAQRRQALQFLVHLVGDLHQPLHAATNQDLGGNLVKVMVRSRERRLHAAWDTDFVRDLTRGRKEEVAAQELLAQFQAQLPGWRGAPVSRVLAESHRLAREVAYGTLPGFTCGQALADHTIELTDAYTAQARTVVAERLAAAAVRIAETLRRALASP
jgi:phage terminase Nu1 subunit (DNA packaging protein)